MKKVLFSLFILSVFVTHIRAQSKVFKYCEITATEGLRGNASTYIIQGKIDSLFSFKDSTVKSNLEKVNTFRTLPDALNYMASLGWVLVTGIVGPGRGIDFFFKREFNKSELSNY
jgi:hypothetical protein